MKDQDNINLTVTSDTSATLHVVSEQLGLKVESTIKTALHWFLFMNRHRYTIVKAEKATDRILGIDPDVDKISCAFLSDGKAKTFQVKVESGHLNRFFIDLLLLEPNCVMIEGQYFNERKHQERVAGGNVKTFERLVQIRSQLEGILSLCYIPFEVVQPRIWQKAILMRPRENEFRINRAERKRRSIDFMRKMARIPISEEISDDVSDAFCIATYCYDQNKRRNMEAIAKTD